MIDKRQYHYLLVVAILAGSALAFRPGLLLVNKSPNREDASYARAWQDGCVSGANSYSLLYAPLLDKPFVKEISFTGNLADKHLATEEAQKKEKETYKNGWNEGFTLCRYYQAAVYELMQFAIIIVTLLFIGYLLARKSSPIK